jgi:hypothetical protein
MLTLSIEENYNRVPVRDSIHETVKTAFIQDGWEITADPYVISYGERFLFVDLGASGLIGVMQGNKRIAIEIKQFRSPSQIADLEQTIGQYMLYLAVSEATYDGILTEPIGKLAIEQLSLRLAIINLDRQEIVQWIPSPPIERSSNR